MRRRDKYKRQKVRNDIIGIALMGIVLCGMGVAVVAKTTLDKESKSFNRSDACDKRGNASVTALVIDNTDDLSEIQKASLRSKLKAIVDKVPQHGKLDIYPIKDTVSGTVQPGFSRCSPGRGRDVSEVTGNPERVEKRWRENFEKPAWDAIEEYLSPSKAKTSPLMETVQSVAISSFGEDVTIPGAEKTLYVVSDMLQNNGALNLYKGLPPAGEFFNSEYFQGAAADLSGVNIEIFFLNRDTSAQRNDRAIAEFWNQVFAKERSADYRITRISG
jgi:hypothetical protein